FEYADQIWKKSTTYINFPVEKFEPLQPGTSYGLYAVVNHFGSMESGHYTAFCRGIRDGDWYEYDDSNVSRIATSRIKLLTKIPLFQSNAAYILFYERLPRTQIFSEQNNLSA
ncbi:uncharacterized protein DEA37_0009082, partial [Paragonimus westermani]